MADIKRFKLPILATSSALATWYWMLLYGQSRLKYKLVSEYKSKGEEFDRYYGKDPRMLAADRIVGNTHEQLIPFLAALWIHAIFVDADKAGKLGFLWVTLRICYSFLMPKRLENRQPKYLATTTFPQYFIIAYLIGTAAYRAIKTK